ncbi:MAG: hypothetical protein Q9176_006407 [Flavoplaca citrina]
MYHPYRYPRSEYYRPAYRAPRDNDDSGRYYRPSDSAYYATAPLRASTRQADTRNEITLDELIAQASANVTNSSGFSRQSPPRNIVLPPTLGAELPQLGEDRPLGDDEIDRSGFNIAPSRRIVADGLIKDRPLPQSTDSTSDAAIEPGIEGRAYGNQAVDDHTSTAENNTTAEDQTSISRAEEGQPTHNSAAELEANAYWPEQHAAHTANNTLSAQLASPEPTIIVDESPATDALEKCKAYERVIARLGSGYIQAQNRLKALSSMSEDPESKAESEAVCTEMASGSNLALRYLREYPATLSRLRPCSNGQLKSEFSGYQSLTFPSCILAKFYPPICPSLPTFRATRNQSLRKHKSSQKLKLPGPPELAFRSLRSSMDSQASQTLRKAEDTRGTLHQASDEVDARSMMRLIVPQNVAPVILYPIEHPTSIPEYLEKYSDTAPSSAIDTCLSLQTFLEAKSDRAAQMSWDLRPFSDYMAENPGLKSLWEKIEQSSLDISMEAFRQTLYDDEEGCRQFSNREDGPIVGY